MERDIGFQSLVSVSIFKTLVTVFILFILHGPSAGCITSFFKASSAGHFWKQKMGLSGLCHHLLAVIMALTSIIWWFFGRLCKVHWRPGSEMERTGCSVVVFTTDTTSVSAIAKWHVGSLHDSFGHSALNQIKLLEFTFTKAERRSRYGSKAFLLPVETVSAN